MKSFLLFTACLMLAGCGASTPSQSQSDYERQQKASDKAMQELTREVDKLK